MVGKQSDNEVRPCRFLITGGGTGGHLFPALAAADEMCRRYPGTSVLFVGTKRKLDRSSLERYGYKIASIHSHGVKGKNLLQLIKAVAVLPLSIIQAGYHIITFKPTVVLGVGGYVTGPVMVAARLLGKKTVIHEQNSIPGLANRKLGKIVHHICLSLPLCKNYFPVEKTEFTGNPVRKAILGLNEEESLPEKKELVLLVLGGSQGAHRVNQLVVEAVVDGLGLPLRVIHQTGIKDAAWVKEQYTANKINALVKPFFHDMADIYRQADVLVSRAGATTLAELAVLGKPAILIPYPHAADNHQHKNADYYVAGGGCVKFNEEEITAAQLGECLKEIGVNSKRRKQMSAAMKQLGLPEAAKKIVDICVSG